MFLGAGWVVADEDIASFDLGATAWLTDRWGLGTWNSVAFLPGKSGGGLAFNPAVRYQRRLRRGRYVHFGLGPGYTGTAAAAKWVFFPQAEVLYSVQAAGNRKFSLRVGARLAYHGLQFVGLLSFTTD